MTEALSLKSTALDYPLPYRYTWIYNYRAQPSVYMTNSFK